jgi:hypothetical protein
MDVDRERLEAIIETIADRVASSACLQLHRDFNIVVKDGMQAKLTDFLADHLIVVAQ